MVWWLKEVVYLTNLAGQSSTRVLSHQAGGLNYMRSERNVAKVLNATNMSDSGYRKPVIIDPHQEIPNDDALHDSDMKSLRSQNSNENNLEEYPSLTVISPRMSFNRKLKSTALKISAPKVIANNSEYTVN